MTDEQTQKLRTVAQLLEDSGLLYALVVTLPDGKAAIRSNQTLVSAANALRSALGAVEGRAQGACSAQSH